MGERTGLRRTSAPQCRGGQTRLPAPSTTPVASVVGNSAVQRMALPGFPGKVRVSYADEPLEREADRMADRVLRMESPEAPAGAPDNGAGTSLAIMRQAAPDGGGSSGPAGEVPGAGNGRPLDVGTRAFFEPRFGLDFSQVRVHTDASAAESAQAVNALAYTYGRHIVFGAGHYTPATAGGLRLIAHELAHVAQQRSNQDPHTLFRSPCQHDAPRGNGCGIISWKGANNELEDFQDVATDRIIASALPEHFGGTWVPQLRSPPNAVKGGKQRGAVDAAKVSAGADLSVEVLEIKSRNTDKGGCQLALSETTGYVRALTPLAPHVVTLSRGVAQVGGLRTDQCMSMKAEEKKKLVDAGLDVNNPEMVHAWCLYNDLQNKLNRTFTSGFGSVTFAPNKDGAANTDYRVGSMPIACKRGKKTTSGSKTLYFQVNGKGGLSYRCDKKCQDQPEDEKKTVPKEKELPQTKTVRTLEQPYSDDEYDPGEDDIDLPSVDVTDVVIVTTIGVSTVAALHQLMKKAKTDAEREILKRLAVRSVEQMKRGGAVQAARHLNSKNIARFGTKAYDEAIRKAEEEAAKRLTRTTEEKLAKRLASRLGKQGAKQGAKAILKAAGRALSVVSVLLFAKEVSAAVDTVSKGGELEFGLSGSEADLGAGTDIKVVGDKPQGGGPTSQVKTEQTTIDMEMAKVPETKGLVELETKQVKVSGKVDGRDGDSAVVNMRIKMQNTTLIIRSVGRFKGGNVVIDGGLDISDSEIEIDLPPDAVLDPPEPGKERVIKGVKVKVTKVGSGVGQPGQGGGSSGGRAAGEGGKGEDTQGEKAPGDEERRKLVGEIQGDANVKKIYDAVVRPTGVRLSEEALRRLLALKAQLAQRPELVDRLLKLTFNPGCTDPIKELIEPMEAEIRRAIEEAAKKASPPPANAVPGNSTDPKNPPATVPLTAPADPCKDAEKFELWSLVDAVVAGKAPPANMAVRLGEKKFQETVTKPTDTAATPVLIGRKLPDGSRSYTVWIHGADMKPLKKWDTTRFVWAADYEFKVPGGLFKSDQGDRPICFTDAGTPRRMTWGRLKPSK